MITQEQLKELLDYDPETGVFTWKKPPSNRVRRGDRCAAICSVGYILIGVLGNKLYAHRLAWLYMTGSWPEEQVDHINGVRHDNRWVNLRQADKMRNMRNSGLRGHNTSGHTGVGFHRASGKWRAYLNDNNKTLHIGLFDSKSEALAARQKAAREMYGDFYFSE